MVRYKGILDRVRKKVLILCWNLKKQTFLNCSESLSSVVNALLSDRYCKIEMFIWKFLYILIRFKDYYLSSQTWQIIHYWSSLCVYCLGQFDKVLLLWVMCHIKLFCKTEMRWIIVQTCNKNLRCRFKLCFCFYFYIKLHLSKEGLLGLFASKPIFFFVKKLIVVYMVLNCSLMLVVVIRGYKWK